MANIFKSSPFENIIKKYTLCVLCDGKVTESAFLHCGCGVILCTYCNEKHICKFHHQAVKFNSYKDNKSIDFIYQLSTLITTQSEKDKEKKSLLENSYSPSLPDLDDLMVDETTNCEHSFSQLFEGSCSRTEKPINSISSLKRESISPRISYTLKRKQCFIDSDDEESFNKSESVLCQRLSDSSSTSKKKITKRIKYSNKNRDTSIGSELGYDSESVNSDKQPLERKRKKRKGRRSVATRVSLGVVNDVSTLNGVSTYVPESCQTIQEPSVSFHDETYVKNDCNTENNSSNFQEFVKEQNIDDTGSRFQNMSNDELCTSNVDRASKNVSLEENTGDPKIWSPQEVDNNEITTSNIVNDINSINPVLKQSDEKLDVYSNNLIKQSKVSKHSSHNMIVESDKKIKHKDNYAVKDFDGFDQCDINASILNYMLYKLTTPLNNRDEMMFPICYKGKRFIIHLTDKADIESNEDEYHYILKPFKTFRNCFVQTNPEAKAVGITQTDGTGTIEACVGEDGRETSFAQTDSYQVVDVCIGGDGEKNGSVQTDSYEAVDACVGGDGGKTSFVQTDSYEAVDACVGGDGEKTRFTQTDSYRAADACVGCDGKISKVSQTDGYEVMDSSTNTKDFKSLTTQTDLINNSSPDLWSRNCTTSAVKVDLHNNKPPDISSDMPYSSSNLHFPSSDVDRKHTTSELARKVSADTSPISDNEDEDIIEGTPIKANNVSLTCLDLSAIKDRTLRFDLNETTAARDEIVSCSDLASTDKLCVQKFTKCFGMEYSEYFNNKTTHLVVSSRLTHDSHRTFKYLIAIASKSFIVSIEWVKDSLRSKEVLPVEKYIPTNQPGPMRCRMNGNLPFTGLTINVQLMINYPGVKAMEALSKLCGAYVVEDIELYNSPQKWPFPRFCLFEDESQLAPQILNSCRKNQIMPINYEWVFDSVTAYCRQPISRHICSTFILTDEIIEKYKIPSDMLLDNSSQEFC